MVDLTRYAQRSPVKFGEIGSLLDLFSLATNWKRYFILQIAPHIRGNVLEVGAGIGTTTQVLVKECDYQTWKCLEPDAELSYALGTRISEGILPENCQIIQGSLDDIDPGRLFDTILYIDVLEHIEDDRRELLKASNHLAPAGKLVVVSPSHNWLYTTFDFAVGHYRRYTRKILRQIAPPSIEQSKIYYLDSIGLFASLANKLLLNEVQPKPGQLKVWDKLLVPLSTLTDPLLGYQFGKQIIAIWRRPAD